MEPMVGKWISNLFSRKPVLVKGGAKVVEGEARSVDLGDPHAGGTRLLLCKVDGEIHALDSRCPHADGQIQSGPLEKGRYAVCPLHRYLFDPATGAAQGVACKPAQRFKTRQQGDDVEVFI